MSGRDRSPGIFGIRIHHPIRQVLRMLLALWLAGLSGSSSGACLVPWQTLGKETLFWEQQLHSAIWHNSYQIASTAEACRNV